MDQTVDEEDVLMILMSWKYKTRVCKSRSSGDDFSPKFRFRRAADNRELKQLRRRRQQERHKFAYLTMKNSIFARFARAFFIFWHFEDVLVLSTTWNDLFCSCVDDVSISCQMLIFVFLCRKRWFQFNPRIARTHFSSIMTLSNWKMIAEPRSYIFRWRSRFRKRRVCLSSLMSFPPALRVTDDCACGFDLANKLVPGFVLVLGS